jgi:hypothetical protein
MRLEVKLERFQMRLPRMAWEKDREHLVDGGWQLEKLRIAGGYWVFRFFIYKLTLYPRGNEM